MGCLERRARGGLCGVGGGCKTRPHVRRAPGRAAARRPDLPAPPLGAPRAAHRGCCPALLDSPPPTAPHPCRRRYGHALDLLLTAITAPTMVLNAITLACLKKYMLVSLVHAGAVPPLPKYTAPIVT